MTEKLYYQDAYIKEFDANLIQIEEKDGKYIALLDRTAFFPEEGGQTADTGMISGVPVLDVKEKDGNIYHYLASPLPLGEVHGRLDFQTRFEKMQCHTAEHILCGIIHQKYGFENVGFHLGEDLVTFDIDGELTREQLDEIELLANTAVFENHKIETVFPAPEELSAMKYRAKLELQDGVRIVNIEGVDSCACCAPHVSMTGEVGIIKLLDLMRHRGGMRITMLAGYRALADYHHKYLTAKHIGALTSTHHNEIAPAVDELANSLAETRREIKALKLSFMQIRADALNVIDKNAVIALGDVSMDELREFANLAGEKVSGILVCLSGSDGDYKYIITSKTVNLSGIAKEINAALGGRGGGRPEMIQGSLSATYSQISEYFGA